MSKENVGGIELKGSVIVRSIDKDTGTVIMESRNDNMIVNTGLERTAKLLNAPNGVTYDSFDCLGWGLESTARDETMTTLSSLVEIEYVDTSDRTYSSYQIQWQHNFTNFTTDYTVKEIGVFDGTDSSSAVMLASAIVTGVDITTQSTLSVTYTIAITDLP